MARVSDTNRFNELHNYLFSVSLCETITIMPRIALAVVGGATVKSKISAPYAVAIGEKLANGSISWFCGGSLISSMEVLTAAHCVISRFESGLSKTTDFSSNQF